MRRLLLLTALVTALVAVFIALLAAPAAGQSTGSDDGVLVRIGGDVAVDASAVHGLVVVIDGDLDFDGAATTVVVVNGDAVLTEATVDELIVVSGTATLGAGSVISGDVQLADSTLSQHSTAVVEGSINRDVGDGLSDGFWLLGMAIMAGWAVLALLAGLLFAGVAPGLARGAGRIITDDLPWSILAGVLLWVVAPIVGGMLFATIIGIPTAITIWLLVLPVLGFLGFLVAAVRIGEFITSRGHGFGHPYLASFTGGLVLIVTGAIPFIGPVAVLAAAFLGSGALMVRAFRAVRDDSDRSASATPSLTTPVAVVEPMTERIRG